MPDRAHDIIHRLADRVKQALLDEGAVDVQVDPDVEVVQGDSVFVGGNVEGVPISIYVNVVPQ